MRKETTKPVKPNWPFIPVSQRSLLVAGLALLAMCLFPFWGSITVAAVFAFGLYPAVRAISRRFAPKRERVVVAGTVLLFILLMLLPFTFFSLRIYNMATAPAQDGGGGIFSSSTFAQAGAAFEKVQGWVSRQGVAAHVFRSTEHAQESIRGGASKIMNGAMTAASTVIVSLPELVLGLLVFCLSFYLFMAHAQRIHGMVVSSGLLRRETADHVTHIMQSSSYNSLVSSLIIGVIQAAIVATGARFAGYAEFVLIFTVVFGLSFIPFIGAAPAAYLLAIVSFLSDKSGGGILLLAVGTFAGTIDNVLRSYLVARGEHEVHPIISFAAILGAIAILGIKGIFLGPVILTATVGFLNLPRESRVAQVRALRQRDKEQEKETGT